MIHVKDKIKKSRPWQEIRYLKMRLLKRKWRAREKDKIKKQASVYGRFLSGLRDEPAVFFICVPTHSNMGDQAQRFFIRKWIEENYRRYKVIEIPSLPFYDKAFRKKFCSYIEDGDVVIVQSGYCTTDSHIDSPVHIWAAKALQGTPILFMPQTVNLQFNRSISKTRKAFDSNRRILFLARDRHSYESARKFFSDTRILLVPDIVASEIGEWPAYNTAKREGVLLCIRNDDERLYKEKDIEKIREHFLAKGVPCDTTDTWTDKSAKLLQEHFEEEFNLLIKKFARYKAVITDRYHGTIFSMIASTPVIVLETKDHKVKTGTEWFRGVYDGSFFNADSVEEAICMADICLESRAEIRNASVFKRKYYKDLKRELEGEYAEDQ